MYSASAFEFTSAPVEATADVTIDDSIRSKHQLLEAIASGLHFPDYFGENWDALIDCLSDLSWLTQREAIIEHSVVPPLPQRDLRLYLESLIDAAARRTHDEVPRLRIRFRNQDRPAIDAALTPRPEAP